jgi:hypothetical protein
MVCPLMVGSVMVAAAPMLFTDELLMVFDAALGIFKRHTMTRARLTKPINAAPIIVRRLIGFKVIVGG